MLGKFFASDVERVEGIGAVRPVFEEVFLGLVFSESVAAPLHAS